MITPGKTYAPAVIRELIVNYGKNSIGKIKNLIFQYTSHHVFVCWNWKTCGNIDNHTYIFRGCPIIQGFWEGVKGEIEKIIEVTTIIVYFW